MQTAYNAAQWSSFFAAEVSAAAALTGLLFVSISINLMRIVELPTLVARAAKSLATLLTVLITAIFCLVPGQSSYLLGCEVASVGVVAWIFVLVLQVKATVKNPYINRRETVVLYCISQASSLPFIIGGISLIAMRGGGLYWLLVAVVASLLDAVLDAWVLLIEIQR